MNVWQVIYGNYFPREVDSVWGRKEDAERKRDELNAEDGTDMWEIEEVEMEAPDGLA